MCLTNLDPEPVKKFRVGYKSVKKVTDPDGKIHYESYDYPKYEGTRYPDIGEWKEDPRTGSIRIYAPFSHSGYVDYPTGWHICLDRDKAQFESTVTIKVQFKDVVASQIFNPGWLYGRQIVARQIKNLGEVPVQHKRV